MSNIKTPYLTDRIQDFLIGCSNLQYGVRFVNPTTIVIFPDFSENSPWKWNNFVSKGV